MFRRCWMVCSGRGVFATRAWTWPQSDPSLSLVAAAGVSRCAGAGVTDLLGCLLGVTPCARRHREKSRSSLAASSWCSRSSRRSPPSPSVPRFTQTLYALDAAPSSPSLCAGLTPMGRRSLSSSRRVPSRFSSPSAHPVCAAPHVTPVPSTSSCKAAGGRERGRG